MLHCFKTASQERTEKGRIQYSTCNCRKNKIILIYTHNCSAVNMLLNKNQTYTLFIEQNKLNTNFFIPPVNVFDLLLCTGLESEVIFSA